MLPVTALRQRAAVVRVPPYLYYLHIALIVGSMTLLIPGLLGLIDEGFSWPVLTLLGYGASYLLAGLVWRDLVAPSYSLSLREAIVVAISLWLLVPVLAAIPVTISIRIPFVDAWFESVSGFTTTGLTMFTGQVDPVFKVYVPRVEELPPSILYWRSTIQWIGGIGILAIFAAFAAGGGLPGHIAGLAEGRYEHIVPSVAKSLRAFTRVYFVYTFIGVVLLMLGGQNLFDALNHAMTGIATGGFSTHSASFAYYNSVWVEAAAIVIMVLGALNFADHYALLSGNPGRMLRNPETKTFAAAVTASILAGLLLFYASGTRVDQAVVRGVVFQVVSSASGTGFQTMDFSKTPESFKFLLSFTNIMGGSILSTTGGIKVYRLAVMVKSIGWSIQSTLSGPTRYVTRKMGDRVFEPKNMDSVIAVVFLFNTTLIVSALASALILPHTSFVDLLFEASSALGNVGLSTGITGAAMPLALKIEYIVLMLLGRLEILPYITAILIIHEWAKKRPRRPAPPVLRG